MWVSSGGWSRGERLKKRKSATRLVRRTKWASRNGRRWGCSWKEWGGLHVTQGFLGKGKGGGMGSVPRNPAALLRECSGWHVPAGRQWATDPATCVRNDLPSRGHPNGPATLEASSPTESWPPPDAGPSKLKTPACSSSSPPTLCYSARPAGWQQRPRCPG